MTIELPLYVNLIFGVLYIFAFTGTWLVVNDMAKILGREKEIALKHKIKLMYQNIKIQRIIALLAGVGMIVLYFYGIKMMVIIAVMFGLFWINLLSLTTRARELIQTIYSKHGM